MTTTSEVTRAAKRIESLKAQRDAALLRNQVRFAATCDREIEKAQADLAAAEQEVYERFGYDGRL